MNLELHQTLQHAVDKGIEAYITSRRARIPMFIHQHFSFRGALALHWKTFGRDCYRHPVNLVWGLPVALVQGDTHYFRIDQPLFSATKQRMIGRVGCWRGNLRSFSISPPPNRACHFHGTRLSSSLI